jgi:hypothetical protein
MVLRSPSTRGNEIASYALCPPKTEAEIAKMIWLLSGVFPLTLITCSAFGTDLKLALLPVPQAVGYRYLDSPKMSPVTVVIILVATASFWHGASGGKNSSFLKLGPGVRTA